MRALAFVLAAAVLGTGCLANSALDESARAVVDASSAIEWVTGTANDVPGLYSSTEIQGPAAAVLSEVHYRFAPDGSFTGAALVSTPKHEYMVLSGSWRWEDGRLYLSEDGEPARLEAFGDLLRLSSAEGTVTLRRRSPP